MKELRHAFLEGYYEARQELKKDKERMDNPFGCKCVTLSQKVLGDGCDICNPELAKELEEEEEEITLQELIDLHKNPKKKNYGKLI